MSSCIDHGTTRWCVALVHCICLEVCAANRVLPQNELAHHFSGSASWVLLENHFQQLGHHADIFTCSFCIWVQFYKATCHQLKGKTMFQGHKSFFFKFDKFRCSKMLLRDILPNRGWIMLLVYVNHGDLHVRWCNLFTSSCNTQSIISASIKKIDQIYLLHGYQPTRRNCLLNWRSEQRSLMCRSKQGVDPGRKG